MDWPAQPKLLIYKRFNHRVYLPKPPFFIFGSSSQGNSVFLEPFQTLIDIGLPVRVYQKASHWFLLHVKYLVITHSHGDHFRLSTFKYIMDMCPNVRVILRPELLRRLCSLQFQYRERFYPVNAATVLHEYRDRIILADGPKTLSTTHQQKFRFVPYFVKHGPIRNLAVELDGFHQRWLYATDLSSLRSDINHQITGLPLKVSHPFDMIMLEANYDRNLVDPLIDKFQAKDEYSYAEQNKRHLSEQESFQYADRMLKPNGLYVPLHASKAFGNYSQNTETAEEIQKHENHS